LLSAKVLGISHARLAFCCCKSLARIDIPETVTTIGNNGRDGFWNHNPCKGFAFQQKTRLPMVVTQFGISIDLWNII
jgi:hypothetical protein